MASGRRGKGPKIAVLLVVVLVSAVALFLFISLEGCELAGCAIAPLIDSEKDDSGSTIMVGDTPSTANKPPSNQVIDDNPSTTPSDDPIGNTPTNGLDAFAQCLTQKGVKMYGSTSCAACQTQKQQFGSAIQYIVEIECYTNAELCTQMAIKRAPTWVFSDGQRLEGPQKLETLAQYSGCDF